MFTYFGGLLKIQESSSLKKIFQNLDRLGHHSSLKTNQQTKMLKEVLPALSILLQNIATVIIIFEL